MDNIGRITVLVMCLLVPPAKAMADCSEPVGSIVSLQGLVETQGAAGEPWQAAHLNQVLCEGASIRVGSRSRAEVSMINQPKFRLDQNSELRLVRTPANEPSLFDLVTGGAYFFSRKPRVLEVDTPFIAAAIEGTEFLVRADPTRSQVTVFEGTVTARNPYGERKVTSGTSTVAEAGQAPQPFVMVHPQDAVVWALYYQPILVALADTSGGSVPSSLSPSLHDAAAAAARGDFPAAFAAFAAVPADQRTTEFYGLRAGSLLAVGRADEARTDIDQALVLDPNNALAQALSAIIAVAQNDTALADQQATRAVELAPQSAAALIALSYAQQAQFKLTDARASLSRAVEAEPKNALAWARLSEVRLMLGERNGSRRNAERAAELAPDVARVHWVRGFAALALFDITQARADFERAIVLDPANPQPRLGLGLAIIRRGSLEQGRSEIEAAVALDPDNSLLRSYLGKAYFEEKRDTLASSQFEEAKTLDPKDPTPWFYDAIQKETLNRPIEALRDLEHSIELNDNRAVYRSRELLDQDRAARGASLGRIYDDVGFTQLGVNEATQSIDIDPGNSSAHRFLSDIYANEPRREIARASELLQAQMLQDININPVQPSLVETDLNIITQTGPASPGFNEFNTLFERNRAQFNGQAVVGNHWTRGGEAAVSGVYDQFSVSASQLYYQSDGWRENNDNRENVTDLYAQAALSPEVNLQGEFRRRRSDEGDLRQFFDPDDFDPSLDRDIDQDTGRIGLRISPSVNSNLLASFIYSQRDAKNSQSQALPFPFDFLTLDQDQHTDEDAYQGEVQYIFDQPLYNILVGGSFYNVDTTLKQSFVIDEVGVNEVEKLNYTVTQNTPYVYSNVKLPEQVTWTFGLAYDDFNERNTSEHTVSPKFGVQYWPWDQLRLHFAAFRAVKPALVASQTLQPTQVAGFNQFYDDVNGTRATTYAGGIDWRPLDPLYVGGEISSRNLNIPVAFTPEETTIGADEQIYRAYTYLTIADNWALTGQVVYDTFHANQGNFPRDLDTFSVPVGVRYFSPLGPFAGLGLTYVNQQINPGPIFSNTRSEQTSDVYDLSAAIGYRFPLRLGLIQFQAMNLLNQRLSYQDDSFREIGSNNPQTSPYVPERTFLARLIVNY